jgi:hypothetical protein
MIDPAIVAKTRSGVIVARLGGFATMSHMV